MVHLFEHNGEYVVMDIASGGVYAIDAVTYSIINAVQPPLAQACPDSVIEKLKGTYTKEEIVEAYGEVFSLYNDGILFSTDDKFPIGSIKPQDMPIKALCLHVSHDCNLRCKYCFAQTGDFGTVRSIMTADIAKKAIDFVIEQSKNRKNIEIDFFGGEPLMAWDVVKSTVEYANEQAKKHDKLFRFTLTTNGVLLSDDVIEYVNKNMSNAVLSIDGRKSVNDEMRKTINGQGSYDVIMPNFKKLIASRPSDKDYYMRGTYTANNLDFAQDVLDIYANGFDQISVEPVTAPDNCGYELKAEHLPKLREEYWKLADKMLELEKNGDFLNFFHFNVDLDQGPCVIKRLRGCGAGCEYVAITPEGDVYPCHQFVGNDKFKMGNIADGSFDKSVAKDFGAVSVYSREKCSTCWARYYCSGGCSAANFNSNGDINASYEIGCELEKMRLECAIYLAVKRAE